MGLAAGSTEAADIAERQNEIAQKQAGPIRS
jgi:hypothetical protein